MQTVLTVGRPASGDVTLNPPTAEQTHFCCPITRQQLFMGTSTLCSFFVSFGSTLQGAPLPISWNAKVTLNDTTLAFNWVNVPSQGGSSVAPPVVTWLFCDFINNKTRKLCFLLQAML